MKQTNEDKIVDHLEGIRHALEAIAIVLMQNQSAEDARKPIPTNLPFPGQEKTRK